MTRKFQRRREDFQCEQCGAAVQGDGYTNHCPHCLWSKHVDDNPGDRACACHGLMEPVGAERKSGETIIVHRCTRCHHLKRNRAAAADDPDLLIHLLALGSPYP